MSTQNETIEKYLSTCMSMSGKANDFVMTMLQREENAESDDLFLKLCGNNKLHTQTRLTDDDVKVLCESLKENSYVTGLDLRYNNITDAGAEYIADLLRNNYSIVELNLMFNDIEEEGAKKIGNALHTNSTLVTLKMTGNKIGNRGGMYLAQALQVNANLEYLDVGECDLKIDSVIAFSTVLNYNATIKGLNVNRPLLWTQQEETTVHFADMLKRNHTLIELHIAKYEMRDFGAARISEAIMDNFSLTVLDLSCNRITRDGAKYIAKVLKENTCLRVLDLAYNRIQDDGATAIAEALATFNTNLKILAITFNEIKGRGLCALADALKFNDSLSGIYIWGNELEESACAAFLELTSSCRLYEDDIDVRPYVVDDVPLLAHVNRDCDYRRFRFYVPIYGDSVPKDKSYALF